MVAHAASGGMNASETPKLEQELSTSTRIVAALAAPQILVDIYEDCVTQTSRMMSVTQIGFPKCEREAELRTTVVDIGEDGECFIVHPKFWSQSLRIARM